MKGLSLAFLLLLTLNVIVSLIHISLLWFSELTEIGCITSATLLTSLVCNHLTLGSFHQIHQLAFSPHTDSRNHGPHRIPYTQPKHVILVHGEKGLMAFLKESAGSELGMPYYLLPC